MLKQLDNRIARLLNHKLKTRGNQCNAYQFLTSHIGWKTRSLYSEYKKVNLTSLQLYLNSPSLLGRIIRLRAKQWARTHNRPNIGFHFPREIQDKQLLRTSWIARVHNILHKTGWHVNPLNIQNKPRTTDTPLAQILTEETWKSINKHVPTLRWFSSISNKDGTKLVNLPTWLAQPFASTTTTLQKANLYKAIQKECTQHQNNISYSMERNLLWMQYS